MGISHLEIHEGQTTRIRCQSAQPTDPDPEHKEGTADTATHGDIYYDSDNDFLYILSNSAWLGIEFTS